MAYLNDVVVIDSSPSTHANTIRALFERRRKRMRMLRLSSKARLGV